MELDLSGLAGPVRERPGGDETAAGLFERIVVALLLATEVLRAVSLAEGVKDGLQGRGTPWSEVAAEPARATVVQVQPQRPVGRVVTVSVGGCGAGAHLLGQPGQVSQGRAGGRGRQQDTVPVVAGRWRQQVGPVAYLPGPRLRHLPRG